MGKWILRVLVVLVIAGGVYYYFHRNEPLHGLSFLPAPAPGEKTTAQAARYEWQSLDEDNHSFRVDFPGAPQMQQVAVTREDGSLDSIPMLATKPEGSVTYAIVYGDNPPVVRVNAGAAEKILDMARDGALRRTHTTLLNEERTTTNGFPARNIQARTSEGATMDAFLVEVGTRLYMLIVVNPSSDVRKQQDIARFFKSFRTSASASAIPEHLPAASITGL